MVITAVMHLPFEKQTEFRKRKTKLIKVEEALKKQGRSSKEIPLTREFGLALVSLIEFFAAN